MLKPFLEMRDIDVRQYCKHRKTKDEDGNVLTIPYLPWAKCLVLLHENGAENVRYRALQGKDGSYLFCTGEEFHSKKKIYGKDKSVSYEDRHTACYFVTVEVVIDKETFVMPYPVMNGTAVVYDDTLNQLRVHNAIQRALVKCVAVNTGLGIKLWEDDDETEDHDKQPEVASAAAPLQVKEEIERIATEKVQRGLAYKDMLSLLGITDKQFKEILQGLHNGSWLLGAIRKL